MGDRVRSVLCLAVVAALGVAAPARAQAARSVRIPLELRLSSVNYGVLPVDPAEGGHAIVIGRTTAYGLQWRHRIAGPLSQVWAVEYAGRRSAYDQGVCHQGEATCERPSRSFAYKEWTLRGTAVVKIAPRALTRSVRWITPYAGAGLGLHDVTEPHVTDTDLVRGRLRTSWYGETSQHVLAGAHMAIPHTRIVGAGEFRWSWMTWRQASGRMRQAAASFVVIAQL